jgi:mRNA interferase MazF
MRRVLPGEGLCHGGSEANASTFDLVIAQGEVWWADLPEPSGSEPGFRRPVIVVQGDAFNRSRIETVVCVPLTSTLRWADAPGNVLLESRMTGLPKDSVANVSQIITLDRASLTERAGKLSTAKLASLLFGVDVVLGR